MSVEKLCHFSIPLLLVINMECTQKQQFIPECEPVPHTKRIPMKTSKQIDVYDRKSAELRRYLASEKAVRELEQRRNLGLAIVQRMSFIR